MTERQESFDDLVTLLETSAERFGHHPLFGTKNGGVWNWTSYKEFMDLVRQCRARNPPHSHFNTPDAATHRFGRSGAQGSVLEALEAVE